ncbi:MAG: transglutaminase family protein [Chlamydiota bacterium]
MHFLLTFVLFFYAITMQAFEQDHYEKLKLTTLYNSLDPTSFAQLFAFYELYPHTPQGSSALNKARELFNLHKISSNASTKVVALPPLDMQAMIALVNKQPHETPTPLTLEQINMVDKLSSHLHNRLLKGHSCTTKEEILSLDKDEIDLARALLIYQFDDNPNALIEIKRYETMLDMMALQILARLPANPSPIEKIDAINNLIFYEMQFRFPPHSLWVNDVDLYTFLPSVLDSRLGVCLGVSILYLSIAQRLDLSLEVITPPGHIYIRYQEGSTLINIETTARGIHLPSDTYLGINTCLLHERTMKEVVGLAFMNQAAVLFNKKDHKTAVHLYETAQLFIPDDPLLKMLLGMQYILIGNKKEGKKLFKQIQGIPFPDAIYPESLPEDYLAKRVTDEALDLIFMHVDETRESIIKKQQALEKVLRDCPKFRGGLFQLAISWLQLGRAKEGLEILHRYRALDPNDPTVNYYISILSMQRLQYKQAWVFLTATKKILDKKNHHPKSLRGLEYELRHLYPEVIHKNSHAI